MFIHRLRTWTIGLPSNMGATNWGGVAVDAQRGLIAVHANSLAFRTKLLDQSKAPPELIATMSDTQQPLTRIARPILPTGISLK